MIEFPSHLERAERNLEHAFDSLRCWEGDHPDMPKDKVALYLAIAQNGVAYCQAVVTALKAMEQREAPKEGGAPPKPEKCSDDLCDKRGSGYCACGERHYGMTYAEMRGEALPEAPRWSAPPETGMRVDQPWPDERPAAVVAFYERSPDYCGEVHGDAVCNRPAQHEGSHQDWRGSSVGISETLYKQW